DVADQRVLDADATAGGLEVLPRGVEDLVDVEAGVDRHQLVAQLVVGCVQRDREGDGDLLRGELADRRGQADRGDGDVARYHPEALRGRSVQAHADGGDGAVVRQRLAHAHEHDVVDAAGPAGQFAAGEHPVGDAHLFEDL